MRKLLTVAFALICLQLTVASAPAKPVRIGVLVSSSTLKLKCGEANGVFRESASGYDCYAPGGTINCDSGGRCLGSCNNCVKASSRNVTGVLRPAPVPPKAGTSVTTTVNGNTTVRDHRTISGTASTSAPPAVLSASPAPLTAGARTIVRDHRKK